MADAAPHRIWLHELRELLEWYETNLVAVGARDCIGNFVMFTPDRFPHFIKLCSKNNPAKEVKKPQKEVIAIREGRKTNADYGGYHSERAQTMPWVIPAITAATKIMRLVAQPLVGEEKTGDLVYLKEFENTHRNYRFKAVVCRKIRSGVYVAITSHPRNHARYAPSVYRQVWP
jgi:hypothetical protein